MGIVLKSFFKGLSGSFILFLLGYFLFWCVNPAHFPITCVQFIGERKYLSQEALRQVTLPELRAGFFRLKVSTLQQQLLSLPWIKQADVRKVWPNKLVINFKEHTPAALWNSQGLLNESGVFFRPTGSLEPFANLPKLQGPDGRHPLVWQQFLLMRQILKPLHVDIENLVLAPRGAWHLRLSSGITVMLGTNDILVRLQRFAHAYEKQLQAQAQKVAYVDLRYTSGMAIGWKSA